MSLVPTGACEVPRGRAEGATSCDSFGELRVHPTQETTSGGAVYMIMCDRCLAEVDTEVYRAWWRDEGNWF